MKSISSTSVADMTIDTMTEGRTTVMMIDMMIDMMIELGTGMILETAMIAAIDAMTDDTTIGTEIAIRSGDRIHDTRSLVRPRL